MILYLLEGAERDINGKVVPSDYVSYSFALLLRLHRFREAVELHERQIRSISAEVVADKVSKQISKRRELLEDYQVKEHIRAGDLEVILNLNRNKL